MATCAFCGEDATLTNEHAWPDWALSFMRRHFPGGGTIESKRWGTTYAKWSGDAVELRVRILCPSCNNVRLKDLEERAQPVLEPLMLGRSRMLTSLDQTILAAWAIKTAMIMEFTSDPGRAPYYTVEERRALAQSHEMPDTTTRLRLPLRGRIPLLFPR
jgi:hypothetical protein